MIKFVWSEVYFRSGIHYSTILGMKKEGDGLCVYFNSFIHTWLFAWWDNSSSLAIANCLIDPDFNVRDVELYVSI